MNGGTEMDVREKQSSEKRLIDYYYLAEKIECPGEPLVYWCDIESAPTVDAVTVVRCRECNHCDPENYHCDHPMSTAAPLRRKPDDFCSYGERKEGADNG